MFLSSFPPFPFEDEGLGREVSVYSSLVICGEGNSSCVLQDQPFISVLPSFCLRFLLLVFSCLVDCCFPQISFVCLLSYSFFSPSLGLKEEKERALKWQKLLEAQVKSDSLSSSSGSAFATSSPSKPSRASSPVAPPHSQSQSSLSRNQAHPQASSLAPSFTSLFSGGAKKEKENAAALLAEKHLRELRSVTNHIIEQLGDTEQQLANTKKSSRCSFSSIPVSFFFLNILLFVLKCDTELIPSGSFSFFLLSIFDLLERRKKVGSPNRRSKLRGHRLQNLPYTLTSLTS